MHQVKAKKVERPYAAAAAPEAAAKRVKQKFCGVPYILMMDKGSSHQLLRPAHAVELKSLHPNHVWSIDASTCVLFV